MIRSSLVFMPSMTLLILVLLSFSTTSSGAPGGPLPPAVSPPAQTEASPGKDRIILSWEEPSSGYLAATGFSIYRSDDGVDFQQLTQVERDVFSYEDTGIIIGQKYYYFIRTDTDLGQSENGIIVTSAADSILPLVEILKPSGNFVSGVDRVSLSWRVEDDESGIDRVEIILDDDPPINIESETSLILDGLDEGKHSVTLKASDIAGNLKEDSTEFMVDLTPPELDIIQPLEGSIHSSSRVEVVWEAEERITEISSVEIIIDGENSITVNGGSSFEVSGLTDGLHELEVLAADLGGHERYESVNITVDREPPSVNFISPVDGNVFDTDSVFLEWEGSDVATDVSFRLRISHEEWIEKGDSISHQLRDLADGEHTIEIEAFDEGGWKSYNEIMIVVDTTPPEIISDIENEPVRSYRGSLELEWELSDETSGIVSVEWSVDDGEWMRALRYDGISIRNLEDGEHVIRIRATDRAGNIRELSISTLWDSVAPEIMDFSPNGTVSRRPSEVEVFFTEEMKRGSISASSEYIDVYVRENIRSAAIELSGDMEWGRTYRIFVWGEDLHGNILDRNIIEFHLTNIALITGRVVDPSGRALSGVTVTLDSGRVTTTSDDGTFEIGERMGDVYIHFTLDGYERGNVELSTFPGEENWAGTIRLEKEDKNSRGRVGTWLSDPVNLIISAVVIAVIMILSSLLWRLMDRDRFTEVEIEMDDERI